MNSIVLHTIPGEYSVYFVGMEILYFWVESHPEKKKRQKKKKGKISTDLASYVFNKSRPEMDINYKYKGTKGKLV